MTIKEAIDFCKEKSKNIKLKAEPEVFVQLSGWLEELSRRRVEELFGKTDEKSIRNKTIDEFVKKLKEHDSTCNFDWEYYDEIAEQLKAGGDNGCRS